MAEPVKNIVLHVELTPEGLINAQLPDNQIITLGMLRYIEERYLTQVVRPGFETKVVLASSVAQA